MFVDPATEPVDTIDLDHGDLIPVGGLERGVEIDVELFEGREEVGVFGEEFLGIFTEVTTRAGEEDEAFEAATGPSGGPTGGEARGGEAMRGFPLQRESGEDQGKGAGDPDSLVGIPRAGHGPGNGELGVVECEQQQGESDER